MSKFLFNLSDGTKVYRGDVLFHPDRNKVGWYCFADFKPKNSDMVTVRTANGAVPTVKISELTIEPPVKKSMGFLKEFTELVEKYNVDISYDYTEDRCSHGRDDEELCIEWHEDEEYNILEIPVHDGIDANVLNERLEKQD